MKKNKTAALHNLGCKVNAYETEVMQQMLEEDGYRIVPFTEKADVYVINTCSVTNMADRKSRQMLHRARKLNPRAVVAAVGCYVQTAHDRTHLPVDADIMIGNNHKSELLEALHRFEQEGRIPGDGPDPDESGDSLSGADRFEMLDDLSAGSRYEAMQLARTAEHTRAFVKVQDGCNQFCSYCMIPYARGRIRSRDEKDALAEITRLAQNGIREIVLTGIHLSSYGRDRQEGDEALLGLIRQAAGVEGIERIRLGSLEPGIITGSFAAGLAGIPQLCPHFHLSLQSGSDTVLRRMNRHYSAKEYAGKCDILRSVFDNPALTTDVIVGFPGETEEEFEQTRRFLEKLRLYETHIFKFSPREGTRAAAMPDQVPERVKAERSDALIALGLRNKAAYLRQWDGKPALMLVEEETEADGVRYLTGYTGEYIRCLVRPDAAEDALTERPDGSAGGKQEAVSGVPAADPAGRMISGTLHLPAETQDIDRMYFVPTRD